MKRNEDYCKFIGFFILAIIVIILLSSPSVFFAHTITVIGTDLSYADGNEKQIRATIDLGDKNCMDSFPANISGWDSMDYNTANVRDYLDADVLLMRRYKSPIDSQPVFFIITHSDNLSSFHPPTICYPSFGYTIIEDTFEDILIHDVSWAEKPLYSTFENKSDMYFSSSTPLAIKKLVVVKEKGGIVTEKRVVLYFYIKNNRITSNEITMVSVSTVVSSDEKYEKILNDCKQFTGEAFSYLFEMQPEEQSIGAQLIQAGIGGISVIIVLCAIPLMILLYPWIKKQHFQHHKNR